VLGEEEGLNIVVSKIVLKRSWVEEENANLKDFPKFSNKEIDSDIEDKENAKIRE
jgi:hypothetical protein